jgi:hypothetical protein
MTDEAVVPEVPVEPPVVDTRTPIHKALDEVKALCCEGETELEHLVHKEQLEAAYAAFSAPTVSNPAPEGTTQITADVVLNTGVVPG